MVSCLIPFLAVMNIKKRWPRFVLCGAPIWGLVMMNSPLGPWLTYQIEKDSPSLSRAQFESSVAEAGNRPVAVVVLSGGVALYRSTAERFRFLSEFPRFATPFIWGKSHSNVHFIFSFGQPEGPGQDYLNEGPSMEKLAQAFGLEASRMHVTRPSVNTHEEAMAVQDVLKEIKPALTYVSTSALHLPRVMGVYRKLQISAEPFPAYYYSVPASFQFFFFKMSNAELLRQSLHELIGNVAYKITGKM